MFVIHPGLNILLANGTLLSSATAGLHMLHVVVENDHSVAELTGLGQLLTLVFRHFVRGSGLSAVRTLFGLVRRCFMFNFLSLFEEFPAVTAVEVPLTVDFVQNKGLRCHFLATM